MVLFFSPILIQQLGYHDADTLAEHSQRQFLATAAPPLGNSAVGGWGSIDVDSLDKTLEMSIEFGR